jgi:hypothetical protein
LSLSVVATDLATKHGGTDANKRDVARQVGRLNVADLRYKTQRSGEDRDRLAHNLEVESWPVRGFVGGIFARTC